MAYMSGMSYGGTFHSKEDLGRITISSGRGIRRSVRNGHYDDNITSAGTANTITTIFTTATVITTLLVLTILILLLLQKILLLLQL